MNRPIAELDDVNLTAIMEREDIHEIKRVPAGFTVMLGGGFYGIGKTVGAAYDMARTDRWAHSQGIAA